jgi:hypothetical protein
MIPWERLEPHPQPIGSPAPSAQRHDPVDAISLSRTRLTSGDHRKGRTGFALTAVPRPNRVSAVVRTLLSYATSG